MIRIIGTLLASLLLAFTLNAEEKSYYFDEKGIQREVLENYLDRSMTLSNVLVPREGEAQLADDIRMIKHTGVKFVGRAIMVWEKEHVLADPAFWSKAKAITEELHAYLRLLLFGEHEPPGLVARVREPGDAHHLRIGEAGAAPPAHDAVGGIGDPRHGRQQKGLLGKVGAHQGRTVGLRHYSSTFRIAMKASCGTSTDPMAFIRFLPSFCFSSSLRLREISPP